jgi:drug/metabolite transporter (DMT)-like permease
MTAADYRQHRLGLILVACAALCWSSAGFFTRAITADLMTMLFWRGIFSGSGVFAVFLLIERGHAFKVLKTLRWPSLAVAVLSAVGMMTGIGSLRYGTVADAMVIYATVPFVTAGLAYAFIGERPSRSTLLASGVALAGVIVMLAGSSFEGGILGKALAFLMTFAMAGFTTVMRRHREVPMLPAMAASAWLCAFFCVWFAAPMSIDARNFALIALFGVMQNAAGLVFYTFGSKRIPAAEATLIAALEVPFTPLWVLLIFNEVPGPYTLLGGAIVLVALFAHISGEFRRKGPRPEPFAATP